MVRTSKCDHFQDANSSVLVVPLTDDPQCTRRRSTLPRGVTERGSGALRMCGRGNAPYTSLGAPVGSCRDAARGRDKPLSPSFRSYRSGASRTAGQFLTQLRRPATGRLRSTEAGCARTCAAVASPTVSSPGGDKHRDSHRVMGRRWAERPVLIIDNRFTDYAREVANEQEHRSSRLRRPQRDDARWRWRSDQREQQGVRRNAHFNA